MKQWIRAAAYAAVCGTFAAAASAQQQHQVVIDAVTGRVRMPDHDELKREPAAAAAAPMPAGTVRKLAAPVAAQNTGESGASRVVQHLKAQPLPAALGAVAMRVPASRLSYSVARRQADGSVDTTCVAGGEAAKQAREGVVTQEHGHAH